MSNKIEVEVKLCKEDRERFDRLIEVLTPQELLVEPLTTELEPVKELTQETENAQESEPQAAAPWDKDAPELPASQPEPAQQYSVEEVQRKVVELSAAGKKAEVREVVTAYAERVSAIPADKLDEVMGKLIALEG